MTDGFMLEILATIKTYLVAPLGIAVWYCWSKTNEVFKLLTDHKVEVARDYVSRVALQDMKSEISGRFDKADQRFARIEDKIDSLVDVIVHKEK